MSCVSMWRFLRSLWSEWGFEVVSVCLLMQNWLNILYVVLSLFSSGRHGDKLMLFICTTIFRWFKCFFSVAIEVALLASWKTVFAMRMATFTAGKSGPNPSLSPNLILFILGCFYYLFNMTCIRHLSKHKSTLLNWRTWAKEQCFIWSFSFIFNIKKLHWLAAGLIAKNAFKFIIKRSCYLATPSHLIWVPCFL